MTGGDADDGGSGGAGAVGGSGPSVSVRDRPAGGGRGAGAVPSWRVRGRVLHLDRPLVMGVINLTPDSFSDGGRWSGWREALDHAADMVADGADLVDVGGESTRPGAATVEAGVEAERILPFVEAAAAHLPVPVSVDTRKAAVARAALEAGAGVVNDVSGLGYDAEMGAVVATWGAGLVLMHMRGVPADMKDRAVYGDVVADVAAELDAALARADAAGVDRDAVVLDPGLGFAKTADQSLTLIRELERFHAAGRPLLVGPSRKSFVGAVTGAPPRERGPGTVAACVAAYLAGARIFRVHDVGPTVQALAVAAAIRRGEVGDDGGTAASPAHAASPRKP